MTLSIGSIARQNLARTVVHKAAGPIAAPSTKPIEDGRAASHSESPSLMPRLAFAEQTPIVPSSPRLPNATEAHWQNVARESADWLGQVVAGKAALGPADQPRLSDLEHVLGRPYVVIPDPDQPGRQRAVETHLRVQDMQSHPEQARSLHQALQTMLAATSDPTTRVRLGELELPVHNQAVAEQMRPSYTAASFKRLFDLCQEHGTFDIKVNPETGLIATADAAENPEMSQRQWVTDTVRCGELERPKAPDQWPRALQRLAAFYAGSERPAFEKAINHPASYRQGGPVEGVAHIFYPSSEARDPKWFNNKRLESGGLALGALCDTLKAGLVEHHPWGFAPQPSSEVTDSISLLANYFMAIDYSSAPSAGNWEETPFPGGLTWDTTAIHNGLKSLKDLLYNPAYDSNPAMRQVRDGIHRAPFGKRLTKQRLDQAIDAGQARVRKTYLAESPGHREMDSSLVFMSQTPIRLDDHPITDARKHLEMLGKVEDSLVRDHGMIRYAPFSLSLADGSKVQSPDSYLGLNYNVAVDKDGKLNLEWKRVLDSFGSKDASDPSVFAARAELSTPRTEAEWFMVSDLANGYVHQAEKLLDMEQGEQTRALLKTALDGAARNINRAYARITGPDERKANGQPCPGWAVPEAYQRVSSLWESTPGSGERETRMLPGIDTPLTWASASLFSASKAYAHLLERLEQ